MIPKRLLGIVASGIFIFTVSVKGQSVNIPPYSIVTLPNGLKVLIMEWHRLPLVEFRLTTRGGSSHDPAGKEGLASITAALLRQGTEHRSAKEISDAIDFVGGVLSTAADLDYFSVSCEVLTKDLKTGLELFSDVVLHPTFPDSELQRERAQRLAEIEGYKEDPRTIAGIAFNRAVFGKHPYAHPAIGNRSSLQSITRDDVTRFYRETFLPNESILTVVGDVQADEMLRQLTAIFGSWEKRSPQTVSLKAPEEIHGRQVVLVDKPDVTQTQIRIGNIGIARNNPDYFPIIVANSILGNGFTSRLVEEIRVKRSLTYGVVSNFSANLVNGLYSIATFTKNATTREVIDLALEEVKKFRDSGATEAELEKAQNYLAGGFARSLQSPAVLAAQISMVEFYGLPRNYLNTYIENLKRVTLSDVQRIAKKYFLYDDLVILVVTPAKQTESSLATLGPVKVIPFEEAIQ